MANDSYENFLRRASNFNGGEPEYYEDTHDRFGNYTGSRNGVNNYAAPMSDGHGSVGGGQPQYQPQFVSPQPQYATPEEVAYRTEQALGKKTQFEYTTMPQQGKKSKAMPLPDGKDYVFPRSYQNIVLYAPRTSADVERLIDYLLRREPAVVNLDPIADSPDAQRILDFISGAVYALGGRILGINTNMFLITPDGVEIAVPEGGN